MKLPDDTQNVAELRYNIYLDDVRYPSVDEPWVIARELADLKYIVYALGRPFKVSFDHDLEDEYDGADCARWLIANNYAPLHYEVHSANPVGAERIRNIMKDYYKGQKVGK